MVDGLKKSICRKECAYLSYVFTCRISSNFSLYIFFSVSFLIFNLFRPHSDPINSLTLKKKKSGKFTEENISVETTHIISQWQPHPPIQSQHKGNTWTTTDIFLHPIVISLTGRLPEGVPIEDQF